MKNAHCFFSGLLAFALACWTCFPDNAALASSQPYIMDHQVNFGTGNKYHAETDLHISGPGLPLTFRRFYNSQSSESSVIGYGWSAVLTERLNITADTMHLIQANGSWIYFVNEGNGTWNNESGKKRSITVVAEGYRLVEPNSEAKVFDGNGRQLSHTDTKGNALTYTYADNQLSTITTNFGQTLSFTYIDGKLSSIVSPAGTMHYDYDANDNLISVTRPDGSVISYLYEDPNDVHNLTGILNEENARTLTVAYDTEDRLISSALARGAKAITIAYPQFLTRTVTNSLGAESTYHLELINGVARVQSFTGPGCSSCGTDSGSAYTYDSRQQVSSITDAKGVITTYTYDAYGNRLTKTSVSGTPLARTATYTYTAQNQVATITEPSVSNPAQKRTSINTYDGYGNLLTQTVSGYAGTETVTQTTTYAYNDLGQVTSMDGPRTDVNDTIALTYYPNEASQGNNRGQLHTVTNPLGQATTYSDYTALGKPGTIVDASGLATTLTYDYRGQLLTHATGTLTTSYAYDPAGRLRTVTTPGAGVITYTYAGDLVASITDGLGNTISYTYDAKGQKTKEEIHDSTGALTATLDLAYDAAGNLSKRTYPGNAEESYSYDAVRNLIQAVDPAGLQTDSSYDAFNRLLGVAEAGITTVTYAYDQHDNLTQVIDARGKITAFTFDDLGNRLTATTPDTGLTAATYDPAGNLITLTDANNQTTSFVYDGLNRPILRSVSGAARDTLFTYNTSGRLSAIQEEEGARSFTYNNLGQLTAETLALGSYTSTTRYGYDSTTGELSSMTYPSGRVLDFTRDATGRIIALHLDSTPLLDDVAYLPFGPLKNASLGSLPLTRSYDQRYQINRIQAANLDYAYTRDPAGQVTEVTGVTTPVTLGATETATYSRDSNQITGISGPVTKTYTHDANGNITSDGVSAYTWDGLNRLVKVEKAGITVATYGYDSQNRRIRKTAGDETILYHYGQNNLLIAETLADGTPLRDYFYLNDEPFALRKYETSPGIYFYVTDHLGTPRQLVTATGTIAWKATYLPFGEAQVLITNVQNNLRFPGQYFDAETGLHYNWHRYYDPTTGRYLSADPIGLAGGMNLYGYVGGDPVNFVDPWGLIWVTTGHDYHGMKNWGRWYLNRWGSQIGKGMDPTFPGADPEELVGLERDVLQEWRPDPDNPCKDRGLCQSCRKGGAASCLIFR